MTDKNIKILMVDDFATLRKSLKSIYWNSWDIQKWMKQKTARKQLIN